MSVRKMADIWEYSQAKGVNLLLLLAIADHANDEGIAYPSLTRLAAKIRRSVRSTQMHLQELLALDPAELRIVQAGGQSGRRYKGHLFQIVIRPNGHGVSEMLNKNRGEEILTHEQVKSRGEEILTGGVRKSSPLRGEEILTGGGEEILTLTTTIEPPLNHHTATATAAAAAESVNGWAWESLAAALKLPKRRATELANGKASPAAFIGLYLYGLAQRTINVPGLWACRQLTDDPTATAGGVYDAIGLLTPGELAALLGWLRDSGPVPENHNDYYTPGAALAWRGFMAQKYSGAEALATAAERAINELGLTALVPQPPAPAELPREPAPAPLPVDAWQKILANGVGAEVSPAALTRLRACRLMAEVDGGGLVVGVPTPHDYDWLSRQVAGRLAQLYSVQLVPAYSEG